MTFKEVFTAYYTAYRAESEVPDSTDDEYITGMRFANEAVNYWSNYENTYWKELFKTLVGADDGDKLIVTGKTTYECPSDMREVGGFVKILNSDAVAVRNIPIVEPQDVQFMSASSQFCYFTGDPTTGFILNINLVPGTSINGGQINYVYYKKPNLFTTDTDTSEVPNGYFIVNRMLANRFRVSRNPYYNSALRDAENDIRTMQADNNSGSWANPWKVSDRSGTIWGA